MTRIAICAESAVDDGELIAVNVGGHRYAVAKVGEQVFVCDDRCPHAGASLGDEGCMHGTVVECGWHEARFDLRNGAPVGGPCDKPVRTYRVTVENGQVCIDG